MNEKFDSASYQQNTKADIVNEPIKSVAEREWELFTLISWEMLAQADYAQNSHHHESRNLRVAYYFNHEYDDFSPTECPSAESVLSVSLTESSQGIPSGERNQSYPEGVGRGKEVRICC